MKPQFYILIIKHNYLLGYNGEAMNSYIKHVLLSITAICSITGGDSAFGMHKTKTLSNLLITTLEPAAENPIQYYGQEAPTNDESCDLCGSPLNEVSCKHLLDTVNLTYDAPEKVIARCGHKFHASCILKEIIYPNGEFKEDSTCPCCTKGTLFSCCKNSCAPMNEIYKKYMGHLWHKIPNEDDIFVEIPKPTQEKDIFLTDGHRYFVPRNSKIIEFSAFYEIKKISIATPL